jgi:hypothetical protein
MASGKKNRATSFILSIVFTTTTDTTIIISAKITVSEIFKSEPFAGSRYKFKTFYIQIRLDA